MNRMGAKQLNSRSVLLALLGVLLLAIGTGLIAAVLTIQAMVALQNGNFSKTVTFTKLANPLVKSVDLITLGIIPDLETWYSSVVLLNSVAELGQTSQSATEQLAGSSKPLDLIQLSELLTAANQELSIVNHNLKSCWLMNKIVPEQVAQQLQRAEQKLPAVTQLLTSVAENPNQTWVILLQNSDEIRPTGGFTGSYALVTITDGQLADITVEDIYDADGQFTGYIDPPPGVKEYTSGNNGLRLPDANWWPDFPKSAQTQLQFLAFGERRDISGVIALNLSVVEQLLNITGPVWLPDNQEELTATNIHSLLRAERGTFFPGSQQKKNLIDHAQSMLRQKMTNLDTNQKLQLLQLLSDSIDNKDIQFYAIDPTLQQLIAEAKLGGVVGSIQYANLAQIVDCGCQPRLIMPVEANVGINKVNRYVDRNYLLQFSPHQAVLTVNIHNRAQVPVPTTLSSLIPANQVSNFTTKDNQNGYVNYLQLLVDPNYQLESISINDQPVISWDENSITTSDGTQLLQFGFLVAIPAVNQARVVATFTTPDGFPPPIVILPKQAGIPVSQYRIETGQDDLQGFWDQDLILQLR